MVGSRHNHLLKSKETNHMEPFPKFVIIFLAAFINVAYGMHNPMMRDSELF